MWAVRYLEPHLAQSMHWATPATKIVIVGLYQPSSLDCPRWGFHINHQLSLLWVVRVTIYISYCPNHSTSFYITCRKSSLFDVQFYEFEHIFGFKWPLSQSRCRTAPPPQNNPSGCSSSTPPLIPLGQPLMCTHTIVFCFQKCHVNGIIWDVAVWG